MSEPATPMQLFRFPCPHCGRVLKAPLGWAGKKGVCPSCQQSVMFPNTHLSEMESQTSLQLKSVISESAPEMDHASADRFAMLISQGTCVEYAMARELLGNRKMPLRQWRRVLRLAAEREGLRMHLSQQPASIADALEAAEKGDFSGAKALSADSTTSEAWSLIVRFVHFLKHDTCPACANDRTGLCCIYQTMDYFITTQNVAPQRRAKWQHVASEIYGLPAGKKSIGTLTQK